MPNPVWIHINKKWQIIINPSRSNSPPSSGIDDNHKLGLQVSASAAHKQHTTLLEFPARFFWIIIIIIINDRSASQELQTITTTNHTKMHSSHHLTRPSRLPSPSYWIYCLVVFAAFRISNVIY